MKKLIFILLIFSKAFATNYYVATVGGHEPSSAKVKIEFVEGGRVIGQQSFSTPTFFGFIHFIVS